MTTRTRHAIAGLALLVAAAPAHGGTLGSAHLYSSNANILDCFVTNVGTRAGPITALRIQNLFGDTVPVSSTCGDAVAPGATCTFFGYTGFGYTGAGQATVQVAGSARALRGQCQLTSPLDNILGTT